MSTLSVSGVTRRFGGLTAVNDVTFSINPGEIFSIIGPNGAGKTTLFNVITGVYNPSEGKLSFNNHHTYKDFSSKDLIWILFIAFLSGSFIQIIYYCQSAWEAVITNNYIYQEAFPWGKAFQDFISFYTSSSWIPALLGFSLGAAAALSIWFQHQRTPEFITQLGMNRTFQNIRLFKEMSVLDNVITGMKNQRRASLLSGLFNLPPERKAYKEAMEKAYEILSFVDLEKKADFAAGSLPYGHQRRIEIARALAADPLLILLDEPAAGMNPSEAEDLMNLIKKIREKGITVLLIEHHMKVVMGISDRIVVLDYGNHIAQGTPDEIRSNPKVIAAYLGKEE